MRAETLLESGASGAPMLRPEPERPRPLRRATPLGRRGARGFTLLELMIVLAILGVLMAIAISSYINYTKRTRMVEVMLAAAHCKTVIFEAYYHGKGPEPGTQWGCETSASDYVDTIVVDDNGKITVTTQGFGDDDLDGKAITLAPLADGDPAVLADDQGKTLVWRCGSVDDGTTVPPKFLPYTCQ